MKRGWSQREAARVGRASGSNTAHPWLMLFPAWPRELSSVKWVHRGMVSLELIQKQGTEHLHLASPSEDLLPFALSW